MAPETLRVFFARASARLQVVAGLRGVAVALGAGAPLLLLRWFGTVATPVLAGAIVAAAAIAGVVMMWMAPRRARAVAGAVEARTAAPRNLLITAAEIESAKRDVREDVRDVVMRDAAVAAGRVNLAELWPLRPSLLWCGALAAVWVAGLSVDGGTVMRARARLTGAAVTPEISRVAITVTPPAYTGRPAVTLADPDRVEALAGSAIHVTVEGSATEIELAAVGARRRLARSATGAFEGELVANEDGFIALQPFGAADVTGIRRVIPLAVTLDHPPMARITAPGKDLFLAKPDRTVPVTIEAADDIGVQSLRLTYTKVTGSGEDFKFTNGEFPLQTARVPAANAPDRWTATSALTLPSLGLGPGDLLVYRAVVADARPGATPVESDAFVIQILMPGQALAEGFTVDDEKDRYAVSQQMIIVKTERLIANRKTMAADEFADQAATLAAEQRKVRAEFVFMMGGEFEDAAAPTGDLNEEAEAANESELAAGRMQNNGRADIITATRYMSRAAQNLTNALPDAALPDEKAALVSLQRAFVRSRYILRILSPRERIDATRRLSGKLDEAVQWRRPAPAAADDPRSRALLAALSDVSQLVALARYTPAEANRLAGTAEALLRLDPALAPVAQSFSRAAAAIGAGQSPTEIGALVDAAAVRLSSAASAGAPAAPAAVDPSASRLSGALADQLRHSGGRR